MGPGICFLIGSREVPAHSTTQSSGVPAAAAAAAAEVRGAYYQVNPPTLVGVVADICSPTLGRTGWMQRIIQIQTILSAHPDFLGLYKSINVLSSPTKLCKLDFEQSEAAFRRLLAQK